MAEDMIGTKFGHLTIMEQLSPDNQRRRRWLCKCDCGGEITINSLQLRRNIPNHCGCQKKVMRSDLTGKQIGKLTILGPSDKRGPRGKRTVPLWECRCECGEICYKATDTLTNPDESMCAKCADKVHTEKARANAGFIGGTQLSKIRSPKLSKANTSGVTGVVYDKRSGKWRAQIGFQGKKLKLGYYTNFADAVKARHRAEEEYFGKFLETYNSANGQDVQELSTVATSSDQ